MSNIFETVLLCDYVIQDVRGKHSAVGIYTGDIIVSELPAQLILNIFLVFTSPEAGTHRLEFEFWAGDQKIADSHTTIESTSSNAQGTIVIPNLHLSTSVDTTFSVVASLNGKIKETILMKKIFKGDVNLPTASLPPALQSSSAHQQ